MTDPNSSDKPTPADSRKRSGAAAVGPRAFAVPERGGEEKHVSLIQAAVLPESTDEDEELLIETSSPNPEARVHPRSEKWFLLALFLLGSFSVILASIDVGMSWDEAYYLDMTWVTSRWVDDVFRSGNPPIRGEIINLYWKDPPGHPSVTRFLVLAGWIARGNLGDAYAPSHWTFFRWPIAFLYGLTLLFLYLLMRRSHGRVTGWLTVLIYFLLPRIFGHAQFAVTETPMVFMTVLVIYAYLKGLESARWAVITGIAFGLALSTKANALLLPVILFPWSFLFYRKRSVNNLYAMMFLSPVVMVATWPWLWYRPLENFLSYLEWNFAHVAIRTFYFGVIEAYPPWHYPFVLAALTIPLFSLFLFLLGIARTIRAPRRHFLGMLYLWAAFVPMLAIAASAAKYDGVRLFLPAFPFIAAVAGIGGGVFVRIGAFFDQPGQRISRGHLVLIALLVVIAVNGGWALLSVKPYYLTYFNSLIGGRKGAAEKGMEITYWCETLRRSDLDRINEALPDGARLMPLAFNEKILQYYQRWGWIKPTIQIVTTPPADYHLLQYRRGMFMRPEWTLYDDYTPIMTFGPRDLPTIGLYETGLHFESVWPAKQLPAWFGLRDPEIQ